MQEGLKELEVLLDPYDWFFEVVAEPLRYVVYVTTMTVEQDKIIPDRVHGKQVVVHFANAKTGSAKDYLVSPDAAKEEWRAKRLNAINELEEDARLRAVNDTESDDVDVPNLNDLCRQLDRLEKQCGPNILFDIFFEIHDGKNAVTNLGARYPEVQTGMKRLYDEYGFDTIYNELDG